ncbi:MAG: hypothetical protein ACFFD4_26940 [Candidatus Odinarchaeota archaeon]
MVSKKKKRKGCYPLVFISASLSPQETSPLLLLKKDYILQAVRYALELFLIAFTDS